MKNVIIVGASRSGKSTVAKKVAEMSKMSYIPFDSIVSTIENLYPEIGIKHLDDNSIMSKKIASLLQELIAHLEYENINYVIDLYQIYPKDLVKIIDPTKHLVVYFGYPNLSAEEKLIFVKEHARAKDWTKEVSNEEMIRILNLFITENQAMNIECLEVGYRFFDTGNDFEKTIELAIEFISNEIID